MPSSLPQQTVILEYCVQYLRKRIFSNGEGEGRRGGASLHYVHDFCVRLPLNLFGSTLIPETYIFRTVLIKFVTETL